MPHFPGNVSHRDLTGSGEETQKEKLGEGNILPVKLLRQVEQELSLAEQNKICQLGVVLLQFNVSSHGFLELKADDTQKLVQFLEAKKMFGKIKIEDDLITAILDEPMDAKSVNSLMFENGITLTHLVQRKESLEEQFLQLTDNN